MDKYWPLYAIHFKTIANARVDERTSAMQKEPVGDKTTKLCATRTVARVCLCGDGQSRTIKVKPFLPFLTQDCLWRPTCDIHFSFSLAESNLPPKYIAKNRPNFVVILEFFKWKSFAGLANPSPFTDWDHNNMCAIVNYKRLSVYSPQAQRAHFERASLRGHFTTNRFISGLGLWCFSVIFQIKDHITQFYCVIHQQKNHYQAR